MTNGLLRPVRRPFPSQKTARCEFTVVTTRAHAEVEVFVQLAVQGCPTLAMWTTLRYTDDRRLVLTLADTAEEVVLVDRGRYALPLLEARVGRCTEVTLLRPDGSRIMLQLEERKRPRHPMGDEAVAAC